MEAPEEAQKESDDRRKSMRRETDEQKPEWRTPEEDYTESPEAITEVDDPC